jgi:RNA recognition motif-containing protein
VIKGSDEDRNVSTCLYVGNLPYSFVEEDGISFFNVVRGLFEKCGRIVSVSVPIDRITTRNKGYL